MRFYFIPTWSGDFRLEEIKDTKTSLFTVENPTKKERDQIRTFLVTAREREWIDEMEGIFPVGLSKLTIRAPVTIAGPVLASKVFADDEAVWTAVRSIKGRVQVIQGKTADVEELTQRDDKKDHALAAVAVRPPSVGCPAPESAPRRASEVLRTFSTAEQWAEFQASGSMQIIGNLSGKRYRLYHRDEAAKRRLGHVLVEAATGRELCVWDATVPAEEEVLAIKLAVEHREDHLFRIPTFVLDRGLTPRRFS